MKIRKARNTTALLLKTALSGEDLTTGQRKFVNVEWKS